MLMHCMIQALNKYQKLVSEHARTIKSLYEEVHCLCSELEGTTTDLTSISSKSKKWGSASALEGRDQINGLGKKFCITQCPWLNRNIFDLPNTFQDDPDSHKCLTTKTSYDKGTHAVLHLMIPEA